ncbi:MAG: hypothetical protein GYB67_16420 [Chloroflexi bacterium]|nr:hypothetical protein [Chloroflexota bacterium]
MNKQRADLTFKDNLRKGRHGWVRLTPAYSVKLVHQILEEHPQIERILDPFSGTGTTGLVAGQRGLHCDLYDINPFLIWLARVKCDNYSVEQIDRTRANANIIVKLANENSSLEQALWIPPISNIERWWSQDRLLPLARIFHALNSVVPNPCREKNLLLIAFCRSLIQWSNAAFNHQSMSFANEDKQLRLFGAEEEIIQNFLAEVEMILGAASAYIPGNTQAFVADSKNGNLDQCQPYDAVITSPPYANRMSYIRELRPYMYWLGYLKKSRDAGELDWQAIGGTWGIATSKLKTWKPHDAYNDIPRLDPLIKEIARSSDVLSRYVHKYFNDISQHLESIHKRLAPQGKVFYVVGNSKFYDTLISVEEIYADLMSKYGFENINVQVIRKRNSKKELFEYIVSADKI